MFKTVFLSAFLVGCMQAYGQSSKELVIFKRNALNAVRPDSNSHFGGVVNPGYKVDYLTPLANMYAKEKASRNGSEISSYLDELSQTISFLGDYKAVLECLRLGNKTVDTSTSKLIAGIIDGFVGTYLVDARKAILEMSKSKRVVMINEAHCRPLHRAFVHSLLEEFYLMGYQYLAMETLNHPPYGELQKLTTKTGYYTCEPVAGELVRKALKIGFKLIPYEDTSATSNSRQRDSAQAMHLYEAIQKDPAAKMLVFAGYGHIEKVKSSNEFVPMAYQFKQLSDIDPLSIDQTFMSEEGNDGFSSLYYKLLQEKYPVKTPSILFKSDQPITVLPDEGRFDLKIIHPPTTYHKGRATWYSLNNERKPRDIKAFGKNCFLIQAYYLDEWKENTQDSIIPADQTYIKSDNKATLYLSKGRYKIVFRDMQYKILRIKNISSK